MLTLGAVVIAERLGFIRAIALTLGQAVAGSSAHAKGVSLGIIEPKADLSDWLTHYGWHGYSGDPMSLVASATAAAAEAA